MIGPLLKEKGKICTFGAWWENLFSASGQRIQKWSAESGPCVYLVTYICVWLMWNRVCRKARRDLGFRVQGRLILCTVTVRYKVCVCVCVCQNYLTVTLLVDSALHFSLHSVYPQYNGSNVMHFSFTWFSIKWMKSASPRFRYTDVLWSRPAKHSVCQCIMLYTFRVDCVTLWT
jgi:hypothetical protein